MTACARRAIGRRERRTAAVRRVVGYPRPGVGRATVDCRRRTPSVLFLPMTPDHDRSPERGWSYRPAGAVARAPARRRPDPGRAGARAGVGVRTVRDLERGRSARPQRTTVELLAGALGLAGPARIGVPGRGPRPGPRRPDRPHRRTRTPPAAAPACGPRRRYADRASAAGRADRPGTATLTELAGLLTGGSRPRWSACVGLAGVGKTALALAVAHAVAGRAPAGWPGCWSARARTADDVLAAVGGGARRGPRPPNLAARLAGRPALLLMDAVERAPRPGGRGAAPARHGALPTLRVLVTGRQPGRAARRTRLAGARRWTCPRPTWPTRTSLAGWPAAACSPPGWPGSAANRPAPTSCPPSPRWSVGSDGLPLAIELMAARGRILDLPELLDRYGDRVLDLAGPDTRRPGLGGRTVGPYRRTGPDRGGGDPAGGGGASYRLLDAGRAGRAASALGLRQPVVGGAGRGDARRRGRPGRRRWSIRCRCSTGWSSWGCSASRGAGPLRFRLLDAVREYAIEQAAGRGRADRDPAPARGGVRPAGDPHRAGPGRGATMPTAVRRLDEVTGDIGAALAHAAGDDPVTALRLAAALTRWWRFRGRDVSGPAVAAPAAGGPPYRRRRSGAAGLGAARGGPARRRTRRGRPRNCRPPAPRWRRSRGGRRGRGAGRAHRARHAAGSPPAGTTRRAEQAQAVLRAGRPARPDPGHGGGRRTT